MRKSSGAAAAAVADAELQEARGVPLDGYVRRIAERSYGLREGRSHRSVRLGSSPC